jgi:hypothetical protein
MYESLYLHSELFSQIYTREKTLETLANQRQALVRASLFVCEGFGSTLTNPRNPR